MPRETYNLFPSFESIGTLEQVLHTDSGISQQEQQQYPHESEQSAIRDERTMGSTASTTATGVFVLEFAEEQSEQNPMLSELR
jgi:hypothetical protein